MSKHDIEQLLEKYLQNRISGEELEKLKQLIAQTNDASLMELFQSQWDHYDRPYHFDPQELARISTRLHQKLRPQSRATLSWQSVRQIAAAVVFLFTTSVAAYLLVDNRKLTQLGEREVVVRVEKGQRADVTLPDGSTVKLNSESALTYRQDFGKSDRTVSLSGEGYFDVVHNAQKKFTVQTHYINVEVLGTSFNFYAYEAKKEVEVTLVSGKVLLSTTMQPWQTATLEPNTKALFNKTNGELRVERTNTSLETAWRATELSFRADPLEQVFARLQRRYGVTFETSREELLQELYTGVFDQEDLPKVMKILSTHFKFSYKIHENEVIIR